MRVHALTTDRGGCFYYRVRQPLTAMREFGHWTSWGSGVDVETWARADVVIGQYLHLPPTVNMWRRWSEQGRKLLVWEADDDITTVVENEAAGNAYRDPETVPRMLDMLGMSHLCTVTTEALAQVYRPYQDRVVVLPNRIPSWLVDAPIPERPEGRPLLIGYTASRSHGADFEWWSGVWARWMAKNEHRTILRLLGPGSRPEGTPTTWRVEAVGWRKDTTEYLRSLPGFADVGIAPLLDTPFSRGKSPIKAMEYAAAGIPCIASDHPVYRGVVVPGVTGFLCSTAAEWIEALGVLAVDEEFRAAMGRAAKEHAEAWLQDGREWADAYALAADKAGVW